MQAECHALHELCIAQRVEPFKERPHMLIDMRAIAVDLIHGGPGQQTPQGSREEGADRLVVRIEQISVLSMKGRIAGQLRNQQKILEEPCGMREMPLRRTAVR